MKYIRVAVATNDITLREILVAQLAEIGFDSFDESAEELYAYIQEEYYPQEAVDDIRKAYGVDTGITVIEQENWNEEWEKGFSPVTVDDFCTIRATFHPADTAVLHDIIVTPKMSFGTGHHATTQLMVQQMRDMDFEGKRVLDFGTGTGVLAILAEKLGATDITAVDNDEWSYENALENIGHNDSKGIHVYRGSLEVAGEAPYDVVLANINRHILIRYMQELKDLLKPGGIVLMSGILDQDEQIIHSEAKKAGLKLRSKMQQEQWICLSFI